MNLTEGQLLFRLQDFHGAEQEALGIGDYEFFQESADIANALRELLQARRTIEELTAVVGQRNGECVRLHSLLDAAEKRIAELERANAAQDDHINQQQDHIEQLEKGHQEAAKQINSWRRLTKQNIAERGKDISELEAARQRIAELEDAQCQHESDTLMLCHQFDELASAMGWTSELAMKQGVGQLEYARSIKARIAELEAKLETADKLQDSAFRDGLKAGFSYGQTDDQSGFAQCMSAYSTRAGIGVKQQEDSVDSDVGRNQPGMVVAVHIGAGDFVKVKGQVFEVEETDFDDHDVTLWFVGGNALKCAAGCPVEVVSAPVAAGIKVKGE